MDKQDLYGLCLKCNTYHTSGDPCDDEPKLHIDSDKPKVHYYNEYQLEDRVRKARAEALREAAIRVKSAMFDYGTGVNASYYSPMIRRDLAAQLAERAILADKQEGKNG